MKKAVIFFTLSVTGAGVSISSVAQSQNIDETEVERVVITGQKRSQLLSDVNASVAVYSGEQLQDMTFTDVSGLYQFTPNVQATVADEGDFAIRGINFRGENLSLTSNVGSFYVDGIFQSTLGVEAGPSGIFDLQQVEIFRGVQSTVQGRNALAGAVIIRTTDPTYQWEAKGRVELAEYNTSRYALAVGGPLIEDQVAFRASFDEYESDNFLRNPAAGIDDINFDDSSNRRAKLLVEPQALPGLSALITYIESEGYAGTGFGTGVANGPDFYAREVSPDITDPTLLAIETRNWAVEVKKEVTTEFDVELVATTSDAAEVGGPRFSSFDTSVFYDFSNDNEKVDTLELRGVLSTSSLNLIGGLYYFEQDRNRQRDLGLPSRPVYYVEGVEQNIENKAVYFDGEYILNSNLALLFGARYDDEDYEEKGYTSFGAEPIDAASLSRNETKTSYDAFLPKLGVRWQQSDDTTWSFVIQRGYRAGGAAIDGNNTAYSFDPEFTNNYELALRTNLLDGAVSLNANVFYTDWQDQQVLVQTDAPSGLIYRTDNAGESSLYGLEVDVTAALSERLDLRVGAGLLDTEFETFFNDQSGIDLSGNRFSQAPEKTLSMALFYEHGNGVFATVDGRYQSDSFSDAQNLDAHRVSGYAVVNAKTGYRSDNWSVSLFARNLFDKDYVTRIRNRADNPDSPLLWEANVGAPRVLGAELNFSF